VSQGPWTVRLSANAEGDFRQIVKWTRKNFGLKQARDYARNLTATITELAKNPFLIGSTTRTDIGANIWSIHVARHGQKGRHFVIYRVPKSKNEKNLDVLRILHDSMEIVQQVNPSVLPPSKD
jgi:toxin ParE1/3/4